MHEAKTYEEYAKDCRRLAATAKNEKDKDVLLKIAAAWDEQAKLAARKKDGGAT